MAFLHLALAYEGNRVAPQLRLQASHRGGASFSNNGQAGLHWRHFPTLAVEHQVQGAGGGIRDIVVRVFGMVNNVFAASGLPFQANLVAQSGGRGRADRRAEN